MKKFLSMLVMLVGVLWLSGCSNGRDVVEDVHYLTTYDAFGIPGAGVVGVHYDCIDFEGFTNAYGEYHFNALDYSCEFDLLNVSEDLFIFDEVGPVNGLHYECTPSGISGLTGDFGYDEGGFDYNTGDFCLIEGR